MLAYLNYEMEIKIVNHSEKKMFPELFCVRTTQYHIDCMHESWVQTEYIEFGFRRGALNKRSC